MTEPSIATSLAVPMTTYHGKTAKEVAATYELAYSLAKFHLKERKVFHEKKGRTSITLVFSFANPDHPERSKGIVSFVILSEGPNSERRSCQMYREFFVPGEYSQYNAQEWLDAQSNLIEADTKALAEVKRKLGSSVSQIPQAHLAH